MKKVICFIDGFNLYHAISDLRDDSLKWLNLRTLAEAFTKPSQEILTSVFNFTAYATWLPGPYRRHQTYIKALEHFNVTNIIGHFKEKKKMCSQCGATWIAHEEKQSDVNLAAYLLNMAHLDAYDKALVVTADSDLCSVIDLVIESFPNKAVTVLTPPRRYEIARELRHKVETIRIKEKHIRNNLLPDKISDVTGKIIAKIPEKYVAKENNKEVPRIKRETNERKQKSHND